MNHRFIDRGKSVTEHVPPAFYAGVEKIQSETDCAKHVTLAVAIRSDECIHLPNIYADMFNVGDTFDVKTIYNHNSCKYFCVSET